MSNAAKTMNNFSLPYPIVTLLKARDAVREHYKALLLQKGSTTDLKFTLDGNLVGDLGEAVAVELFGISLVEAKSTEGIDGYAADGRSVQVKATGTKRGAAFRKTETRADHLLFFCFDFQRATGTVVYNGPEHLVTTYLPPEFQGQRSVSRSQIAAADALVRPDQRLPRLDRQGR